MTGDGTARSDFRLPRREGHFLLESGLHAGSWLDLEGFFTDPEALSPRVDALAARLEPHGAGMVCGPLIGGALLAQAVAAALGALFAYSEPAPHAGDGELFRARYRLPGPFAEAARGRSVALVDDAISAGSSVRATRQALVAAGADVVVVGTLLTLGEEGLTHLASEGVPVEALERRPLELWAPRDCPLCRDGRPLVEPTRG